MNINELIKELENTKNAITAELQKKAEEERKEKEKERKTRLICRKFADFCTNTNLQLGICLNNCYKFKYFDILSITIQMFIDNIIEFEITDYTINETDPERKVKEIEHLERIIKVIDNIVDDINNN